LYIYCSRSNLDLGRTEEFKNKAKQRKSSARGPARSVLEERGS
jgi:hypothetical protein